MYEENKKQEIQKEGEVGTSEKKIIEKSNNIDVVEDHQEDGEENIKLKLLAMFVVAVLVGVVMKAQATKTIITGFDDYRISEFKSDFNFEEEKLPVEQQEQK